MHTAVDHDVVRWARLATLVREFTRRIFRGAPPDSENQRVHEHLLRAATSLKKKGTAHLPLERARAREAGIRALERYAAARRYPKNRHRHGVRIPVFVDDEGTHCAVAHMIASAGRSDIVRQVRADHNYALVAEMRTRALLRWADDSGFSVVELALVQPCYGCPCASSSERTDCHYSDSCGLHLNQPDGIACHDAFVPLYDKCHVREGFCSGGECQPSDNCDDDDSSTLDICDPKVGCIHEPQPHRCSTARAADASPMGTTGALLMAVLALLGRRRLGGHR